MRRTHWPRGVKPLHPNALPAPGSSAPPQCDASPLCAPHGGSVFGACAFPVPAPWLLLQAQSGLVFGGLARERWNLRRAQPGRPPSRPVQATRVDLPHAA